MSGRDRFATARPRGQPLSVQSNRLNQSAGDQCSVDIECFGLRNGRHATQQINESSAWRRNTIVIGPIFR